MSLYHIVLHLARDPDFPDYPEGSSAHGYDFVAPLGADGRIDLETYKTVKDKCRVTRFWGHEGEEKGVLRHGRQGWYFHYETPGSPAEDEPGYRFADHQFREGDYVSVREQDGALRTFRVDRVRPFTLT